MEVENVNVESVPAVDVAKAVIDTVEHPSLPVLVEDLMLVHQVVNDVKSKLAGKHAGLKDIFLVLFNLV